MTNPEPAGAGTAEETRTRSVEAVAAGIAWRLEQALKHAAGWRLPGRLRIVLRDDIASAITAAESRAMERCAKIVEAQPYYPDTNVGMRQKWVKDQIAATIRSSINPPAK